MIEKKPNRLLQRIFEVRRARKIGLDKLAKPLRVKTREAASKIENGQNPLNANYLEDVAELLGMKIWELFVDYESGEIGPLSQEEKSLVLEYRRMATENKPLLEAAAKGFK